MKQIGCFGCEVGPSKQPATKRKKKKSHHKSSSFLHGKGQEDGQQSHEWQTPAYFGFDCKASSSSSNATYHLERGPFPHSSLKSTTLPHPHSASCTHAAHQLTKVAVKLEAVKCRLMRTGLQDCSSDLSGEHLLGITRHKEAWRWSTTSRCLWQEDTAAMGLGGMGAIAAITLLSRDGHGMSRRLPSLFNLMMHTT